MRKSIVAIAVLLFGVFAGMPSASAASAYDSYYTRVDNLNLTNMNCQNPSEDVSSSWSQYVTSSSWGSSFANAQSSGTGSWGVSLLPHYHGYPDSSGNTVVSSNAVIVYWSETSKMTVQWTSTGYMIAQSPDHTVILQLGGAATSCSISVGDYGSQGNIGTGYISSTHGDVVNYFFNGDASYPTGYAGPQIAGYGGPQSVPAALNIATTVGDYEPWTDPTDQPFVRLTVIVTNASGAPAVGATVHFSNAPEGHFVVPADGIVSVVEDVSKGVSDLTVNASLDSATTSKAVHVFDATDMTTCRLPGEPRQTDAIGQLLDNLLVNTPVGRIGEAATHLYDFLGAIHAYVGATPNPLATVSTATRYTGSFSTIYGLSTDVVVDDSSQAVVKTFPNVFSRNYDLVRPLFTGDGTPLQVYGRSLVCHPMA